MAKFFLTVLAIVLAFALGGRFATLRNDLAARCAAIAADRAQLDSAFTARTGLVSAFASAAPPPLSDAQAEAADAGSALAAAQTPQAKTAANDRLSAAFLRLQSLPGFADASDGVSEANDRIAEAREKYNGELEHYNAILQTFPVNLVAAICGYARSDAYFKTPPVETPVRAPSAARKKKRR
jgi:LemA protein